jgi:hypothetical protein
VCVAGEATTGCGNHDAPAAFVSSDATLSVQSSEKTDYWYMMIEVAIVFGGSGVLSVVICSYYTGAEFVLSLQKNTPLSLSAATLESRINIFPVSTNK